MNFFLGNRKLVKADEDSAAEGLEGLAKAVEAGVDVGGALMPAMGDLQFNGFDLYPTTSIAQTTTGLDATSSITPTISGATKVDKASTAFTYIGDSEMAQWSISAFYIPSNHSLSRTYKVAFRTNAPELEFIMYNYNTQFNILVNGKPIQHDSFTTSTSGNIELLYVNFGDGAAFKDIEVIGFNMPFGGVFMDQSNYLIGELGVSNFKSAFCMGDSYTQSTGADSAASTWFESLMSLLNVRVSFADGSGGTGYLTASPNTPTERVEKYLDNLSFTPDYLFLAMGYNDYTGDNEEFELSVKSTIESMQLSQPNSTIYVLTPWTPAGGNEQISDKKEIIESVVASYSGVTLVDISECITSLNYDVFTNGDNVHVNQGGHNYLAEFIYNKYFN